MKENETRKKIAQKKTETFERGKKEYDVLPERVKAIIWGLVLGDGSIKINKGYANARLSFRHSVKQRDYFEWKVSELRPWLSTKKDTWEQTPQEGEKGGNKLRYQSGAKASLTYVYNQIYKESQSGEVKIRRRWLNEMTQLSLAVWWCDEGTLVGNRSQGVMCTEGYRVEDVLRLSQYLKEVWGVATNVVDTGKTTTTGHRRYRLTVSTHADLQKWLKSLIPYIPTEGMMRKAMLLYKQPEDRKSVV